MKETPKICPCCGQTTVGEYDICQVCDWENDPIQYEHPNMSGGANSISLNEARKLFQERNNAENN